VTFFAPPADDIQRGLKRGADMDCRVESGALSGLFLARRRKAGETRRLHAAGRTLPCRTDPFVTPHPPEDRPVSNIPAAERPIAP
jgi:hypothetical protein